MKIANEYPPIWQDILDSGMNPDPDHVLVTYGDTIYVPSGAEIPDHLIEHEETHCDQQGNNPDAWWSRYIDDQYFRIDQETEAYANQYAYICAKVKDRNERSRILNRLAAQLSGPTYGNVISHQKAYQSIKQRSKVTP